MTDDPLMIGDEPLHSRLLIGSGKFADDRQIPAVLEAAGAEIITVAVRRVDFEAVEDNVTRHIPPGIRLLPNTSGARNADEAVRLARLARATGCGNWVKIEIITDNTYLLPDGYETVRATETLAAEGFVVLPYVSPDLMVARALVKAGAAAVMPLGAPIGSNRGLETRELVRILVNEIDRPVIVDAGLGRPSQACEAMEMGVAACMVNTAISSADDPVRMAAAFRGAIEAGRAAYRAGPGRVVEGRAVASSPLTGFLDR